MELVLKNVDPKDFFLLKELSQRLGIVVETSNDVEIDPPNNKTVAEDLHEAIAEIKHSRASGIPLQDLQDLINEL